MGVAAVARTEDGRWILVRRSDTGEWAFPGGTLEWGEELRTAIRRELGEEAGVDVLDLGPLVGVYSASWRDPRFHAVTVLVAATVSLPSRAPMNSAEISEVGVFRERELPRSLSHGMTSMLEDARANRLTWE